MREVAARHCRHDGRDYLDRRTLRGFRRERTPPEPTSACIIIECASGSAYEPREKHEHCDEVDGEQDARDVRQYQVHSSRLPERLHETLG